MVFALAVVADAAVGEATPVRAAGKWLGNLISSSPIGWIGGPTEWLRQAIGDPQQNGLVILGRIALLLTAVLATIYLAFPVFHRYPT
jgi:hypothetical protein